jgi:hypothetical protein
LNLEHTLALQFERIAGGAQHAEFFCGEKLGDQGAGGGQGTGGGVVHAVEYNQAAPGTRGWGKV